MKCSIVKNLDIEAEVDVDLDDVINEFFSRVNEENQHPRLTIAVIDSCTRILGRVPDKAGKGVGEVWPG